MNDRQKQTLRGIAAHLSDLNFNDPANIIFSFTEGDIETAEAKEQLAKERAKISEPEGWEEALANEAIRLAIDSLEATEKAQKLLILSTELKQAGEDQAATYLTNWIHHPTMQTIEQSREQLENL